MVITTDYPHFQAARAALAQNTINIKVVYNINNALAVVPNDDEEISEASYRRLMLMNIGIFKGTSAARLRKLAGS
jgi:hypothetical protein